MVAAVVTAGLASFTGCAVRPLGRVAGAPVRIVAAENFWGSIAAQVGGPLVRVSTVIDNPATDPHSYEPTAGDARAIASADLVIVNGLGYDGWADKLVAANPNPARVVLTVGTLLGVPSGGNPHRWYDPAAVERVAGALAGDLARLDPPRATAVESQRAAFVTTSLAGYRGVAAEIRRRFLGVKVGASESIFALLAPSLGLDLVTPPGLLTAVTEGSDPTVADKATADAQLAGRTIAVYIYNAQNSTPDVQTQVSAAKARGIPVVSITETLVPATATFEEWQTEQLVRLRDALAVATHR